MFTNYVCNNIQLLPSWGEHWKFSKWGWYFFQEKTTPRELTTKCSPHVKVITVLLYQIYSKMFNTWMLCFSEDKLIISCIENTITLPIVDWVTTYCFPLHYISGCLLRQQIFRNTSKLSYYFYIVNNCVRYNI